MKLLWQRGRAFFRYFLLSRHYKGFGIHSPFVFYLVREIFYEGHPFYAFKTIEAARRMMLKNKQTVYTGSFGASSAVGGRTRTIKELVASGSLPPKYGRLLFRLINHFSVRNIVEIGTGTGVGTLFLALPDSSARITTVEGNHQLSHVAQRLYEVVDVKNVTVVNGIFRQVLPEIVDGYDCLDLVYFDGDHRYSSTLEYFEMCLRKIHNDSIFVFDDIHWSCEMEKVWKEISCHPRVTVSIDLYRIGIVFFRRECSKQHYVVRF
ncbi:MAG: class I SAM-dependent methyltransferase [Marinilabilia sp.]